MFFPQFQEEDDDIGLAKGTFNDLMKVIDDDDEEQDDIPSTILTKTTFVEKTTSVEQVDGSVDNWSRASQSPPQCLSSAEENDADDNTSVIRKRMRQMQQSADSRPKSKFALIKRVFSTYTKKRKIVIVKYKQPESRLYDWDEYQERKLAGTLNEPYDEEQDDTLIKVKLAAAVKRKGSVTENEAPIFIEQQCDPQEVGEEGDSTDFHCSECDRTFPNLIRFHAHMQMHKAGASKKRTSSPASANPAKKKARKIKDIQEERILQVDGLIDLDFEDEQRIPQLDGETDFDDLIGSNDLICSTPSSMTTTSSSSMMSSTMAQITQAANGQLVVSTPSSPFGDLGGASIVFSSNSSHAPTHLLILKRHPGEQDSLIQFESSSMSAMSQQSAPTLTSVAMSYGGPFRCDRCSEGFRSRKALNNHCATVHTVSK